ncbi:MAG: hypothetical protein ACKO2P_13435, partial [Planctomycetota bacterium]
MENVFIEGFHLPSFRPNAEFRPKTPFWRPYNRFSFTNRNRKFENSDDWQIVCAIESDGTDRAMQADATLFFSPSSLPNAEHQDSHHASLEIKIS